MNDEEQKREQEDEELAPPEVLNLRTFGRRLRALRVLEGFDRASDFTAILRSRYGVDVSDRSLYAIERGEQPPALDFTLAVVAILGAPLNYFSPAIRADVFEALVNPRAKI